jgi:hypothetical protein
MYKDGARELGWLLLFVGGCMLLSKYDSTSNRLNLATLGINHAGDISELWFHGKNNVTTAGGVVRAVTFHNMTTDFSVTCTNRGYITRTWAWECRSRLVAPSRISRAVIVFDWVNNAGEHPYLVTGSARIRVEVVADQDGTHPTFYPNTLHSYSTADVAVQFVRVDLPPHPDREQWIEMGAHYTPLIVARRALDAALGRVALVCFAVHANCVYLTAAVAALGLALLISRPKRRPARAPLPAEPPSAPAPAPPAVVVTPNHKPSFA